ncbi:putative Maebl [Giardia muris]|uniref:Putative Maebl n=1 Tax=Giardia muris TaxID=5742 RepID=A0A4Z1SVJ7_GIAMU|nr:putative Maebl [Giardia muris]|eukprot:TNJ28935.1 putative Maebl [Giardia muris]
MDGYSEERYREWLMGLSTVVGKKLHIESRAVSVQTFVELLSLTLQHTGSQSGHTQKDLSKRWLRTLLKRACCPQFHRLTPCALGEDVVSYTDWGNTPRCTICKRYACQFTMNVRCCCTICLKCAKKWFATAMEDVSPGTQSILCFGCSGPLDNLSWNPRYYDVLHDMRVMCPMCKEPVGGLKEYGEHLATKHTTDELANMSLCENSICQSLVESTNDTDSTLPHSQGVQDNPDVQAPSFADLMSFQRVDDEPVAVFDITKIKPKRARRRSTGVNLELGLNSTAARQSIDAFKTPCIPALDQSENGIKPIIQQQQQQRQSLPLPPPPLSSSSLKPAKPETQEKKTKSTAIQKERVKPTQKERKPVPPPPSPPSKRRKRMWSTIAGAIVGTVLAQVVLSFTPLGSFFVPGY